MNLYGRLNPGSWLPFQPAMRHPERMKDDEVRRWEKTPPPSEITEWMTPAAWHAYQEVDNSFDRFDFRKPLPGWRIDHVYEDGTIADYPIKGIRRARCITRLNKRPSQQPLALAHCGSDCACGYRLIRDPWRVIDYFSIGQIENLGTPQPPNAIGHGQQLGRQPVTVALTRTWGYGMARKNVGSGDPPGTIRVAKTRLAEVFLPTVADLFHVDILDPTPTQVPESLADRIHHLYGVNVQRIDGLLTDFEGTPIDMDPPEGWELYQHQLRTLKQETIDTLLDPTQGY